jgi:outer membrane protein W
MKFRALVIAVFVMAFGAMLAHAAPSQGLDIHAGLSSPTGDFSKAAGMGFHGGATYCYKLNEQFGVGVDANYHMFGEKSTDMEILGYPVTLKDKFSMIQGAAFAKYFIPMKDAKIAPYLKAGFGYYSMSLKATLSGTGGSQSQTTTQSKPGFCGGIGADMKLNDKASVGLEGLYHQIQTDNKAINMFTVAIGYHFNLGK